MLSEEENPMLHRTDVTFRVSHVEATPDRLAVRDSLAARLNKDADEVVIRTLETKFGMRTTIGEAKVYEGPEFAKDVEQAYMLERNKIATPEGGADDDGPGDEPAADEPAEETDAGADDEAADEPGDEAAGEADEDGEPAATDEGADAEAEEAE